MKHDQKAIVLQKLSCNMPFGQKQTANFCETEPKKALGTLIGTTETRIDCSRCGGCQLTIFKVSNEKKSVCAKLRFCLSGRNKQPTFVEQNQKKKHLGLWSELQKQELTVPGVEGVSWGISRFPMRKSLFAQSYVFADYWQFSGKKVLEFTLAVPGPSRCQEVTSLKIFPLWHFVNNRLMKTYSVQFWVQTNFSGHFKGVFVCLRLWMMRLLRSNLPSSKQNHTDQNDLRTAGKNIPESPCEVWLKIANHQRVLSERLHFWFVALHDCQSGREIQFLCFISSLWNQR